ncbi:MAG: enoyl-CoA hydratase [Halioglobus sp.]|nr:enoyl-CoA hydratase [Halioglobus sp.]|tara:strand:+ start:368 stop:1183 length:816 start_codon:yes stop_codon:yes gene_type:complete
MTALPATVDARLEFDAHVATLSFARDDVRNELTGTALVEDICATVHWANSNPQVRALVITGEGRAFSAGGNVKDIRDGCGIFAGAPARIAEGYRHSIQRMTRALHGLEVPAIAAVNGPGIGAGFDLACMCDIRLGSPAAKFGETFLNLGLIPGDGGAFFLQRLVGYQRAAELTFSGRVIDADEALQLGLLLEIVAAEELVPRARALAADFASKPPQALRMSKRLMKAAQRMQLEDLLDMSASFQASCHHSEDHRRAMAAMLEKSPAVYTGD